MSPSGGEGLARSERLLRRADFQRCYRQGRKRHGVLASLYFQCSPDQLLRLGVTATRKVGNAVVRHRLKRRVREVFRRFPERDALARLDVVVHLRPQASSASFADFARDLRGLLAGLPRRAAA